MHYKELLPLLARHGLSLRKDVLAEEDRSLLSGLRDQHGRTAATTSRLHRVLDVLHRKLPLTAMRRRLPGSSPRLKRNAP